MKALSVRKLSVWDWSIITSAVFVAGATIGADFDDVGVAMSAVPLISLLLYAYIKRKAEETKPTKPT